MNPTEARSVIKSSDNVSIVEEDLDPDDKRMGRAQFLVSPVSSKDEVKEEFKDSELDVFEGERAPNHLMYLALPP